jgi:ABC-type glycerol-3-phosphate transport system substrate-binding protein
LTPHPKEEHPVKQDDSGRCQPIASAVSRRRFLQLGGGTALAAALAACTGTGTSAGGAGTSAAATSAAASGAASAASSGSAAPASAKALAGSIQWWDTLTGYNDLINNTLIPNFLQANPGVKIKRQGMKAPNLVQALQLAKRNNQLPDMTGIHTTLGVPAALVADNWFSPIGDYVDLKGTFVDDYLYEGIHIFNGQVYSFPIVDRIWHQVTPWVNTAMLDKAGVEATQTPTWDGLRALLKTTQAKNSGKYGLVVPLKQPFYANELLDNLASFAGFQGTEGVDWKTGEYVWDSQPFLDTMEFLVSLKKDGVLDPAGPSMAPPDAMQRWAAGETAIYLYGPWILGSRQGVKGASSSPVDAWRPPSPDGKVSGKVHVGPSAGDLWLTYGDKQGEIVGAILQQFTTQATYAAMAKEENQAPIDYTAVASSDAPQTYKQVIAWEHEDTKIGPAPEARNPDYAKLLVEMRDVHPDPGDIVTSILTGASSDYKGALTKYNSAINAERDRAIKAVQAKGAKVSHDDWVFSNWDPEQDYTPKQYSA